MNRSIEAGAVGGLAGGIVFDVLMRVLPVRAGHESMITFATRAFDAAAYPMVGWLAYLIYGVVLGVLFGLLFHAFTADDFTATLWGVSYGAIWWILGELVLIPALLRVWPFTTQGIQQMRSVAMPLLIGHLAYGVILGLVWGQGRSRPARSAPVQRAV